MKADKTINRTLSIAPMMACTDRHYRYFARLISRHVLLYSEMVTSPAIIHGDRDNLLNFNQEENPLALQLGGSDPKQLAVCSRIGQDYGYDEINLNVGCPSDRVQSGRFGACLIKEPGLVAECVAAMQNAVDIPVTVKTRIGVDDQDSYAELCEFIKAVSEGGCQSFTIHARKAWLSGLSPKENRDVPPLRYDVVYQLKQDFPGLEIIINGGVKTIAEIKTHLDHVDGVMIGREAYANPWLLAEFDSFFSDQANPLKVREVVMAYLPYIAEQMAQGVKLRALSRFLVGLFQGQPGARYWRRFLSENGGRADGVEVVTQALDLLG